MAEKAIKVWEPFRDMTQMREDMERLFDSFMVGLPRGGGDFLVPTVDIEETDGNIQVKAEIPGLKKEDIKVQVNHNVMTISGEKKHEAETKEKTFYRVERSFGRFQRTISLPAEVDSSRTQAVYKDGVLSVTMPKLESSKNKRIEVEVK